MRRFIRVQRFDRNLPTRERRTVQVGERGKRSRLLALAIIFAGAMVVATILALRRKLALP